MTYPTSFCTDMTSYDIAQYLIEFKREREIFLFEPDEARFRPFR